jgi:hypothetical protein
MGQARRRGNFEQRKSEAEFYAMEQKRLDDWLYNNRPVVAIPNTHGGYSHRRTSSLQRALMLCVWAGSGAYIR